AARIPACSPTPTRRGRWRRCTDRHARRGPAPSASAWPLTQITADRGADACVIRIRRRRHARPPKLGTQLVVIQVFARAVARASIGAKLVRYVASMTTKGRPRDYLTREEVRFTLRARIPQPAPVGQDRLIDVCATPISSRCGRGGAGSVMNPFNAK